MPKTLNNEFIFQIVALLLSFIFVHVFYVGVVRPNAETLILAAEMAAQAGQNVGGAERSLWIVLKDYEQEACFILAFWAIAIMGFKARRVWIESKLLQMPLIDIPSGSRVLPEDSRALARNLESLPEEAQDYLLPRAIYAASGRRQLFPGNSGVSKGCLRVRITANGYRTLDDSLHCLGNSIHWVYRNSARYWFCPGECS
jgi:hypothetical protein